MSSFLRTASSKRRGRRRSSSSSSGDYNPSFGSSPPGAASSPRNPDAQRSSPGSSPLRGFQHNSERMLSSPLKQERLGQYQNSIQKRREERVLQSRGGIEEMLALPLEIAYKEYMAQSNREMDEYESTMSFETFEREINQLLAEREKGAYFEQEREQNAQSQDQGQGLVIRDEVDLLEDMLRQEEEEINYLVSQFMDTTLIGPSDLEDEEGEETPGDDYGSSTSVNPDSFGSDDYSNTSEGES